MSPEEVCSALRKNTHIGFLLFKKPEQPFMGHVDGQSFSLIRVLRDYRNSFVPKITGHILPNNTGSKLQITMSLLPFVKLFLRFWFGFLFVLGPVFIAVGIFSSGLEYKIFIIIPIAMFAFGYALTQSAFRFEIPKTKDALLKIIDGQEETSEKSLR